jgi:carbonic anhydrase/acetyltransferase-like protein (isoleucine patch superfamily)
VRHGFDVGNGLGAVIRSDDNPFAIGDCITLQGGAVCRNAA